MMLPLWDQPARSEPEERLFPVNPPRNCLINPSPTPHCMLAPGTGHCPAQSKHVRRFPCTSTPSILPYSILILQHLPCSRVAMLYCFSPRHTLYINSLIMQKLSAFLWSLGPGKFYEHPVLLKLDPNSFTIHMYTTYYQKW